MVFAVAASSATLQPLGFLLLADSGGSAEQRSAAGQPLALLHQTAVMYTCGWVPVSAKGGKREASMDF